MAATTQRAQCEAAIGDVETLGARATAAARAANPEQAQLKAMLNEQARTELASGAAVDPALAPRGRSGGPRGTRGPRDGDGRGRRGCRGARPGPGPAGPAAGRRGIQSVGTSIGEGFEALDEEEKHRLLGKIGLAGPCDTVTRLRSQAREGLAGALGLRPPTLAGPAAGGLTAPQMRGGPEAGGGSAASSAVQGALRAGAQSLAKNVAKKAIGTL